MIDADALFSTLTFAFSSLPCSSRVAMSLRAVLACADFFSCSMRSRWTAILMQREHIQLRW